MSEINIENGIAERIGAKGKIPLDFSGNEKVVEYVQKVVKLLGTDEE